MRQEVLLPHESLIRAGARKATVNAVQAELSGERKNGFALRRATREIGEKMMVQGKHATPFLVGNAVIAVGSG